MIGAPHQFYTIDERTFEEYYDSLPAADRACPCGGVFCSIPTVERVSMKNVECLDCGRGGFRTYTPGLRLMTAEETARIIALMESGR